MKIFVICNGKGGVGKTTIARHLVYASIERRLRTLVVDFDPQGDLSKSLLYQRQVATGDANIRGLALSWEHMGLPEVASTASSHLLYEQQAVVVPMPIVDNVSLLGATPELADVLTWPLDCALTAKESLQQFDAHFDLCVIDTPPTLSNLVVAGMVCAKYVVIPTDMDINSMSGMLDLSLKLELVQKELNPDLELLGVVLNKVNPRRADDRSMRTTVRNAFEGAVLDAELQDRAGVRRTSLHPVWKHQRGDSDRKAAEEMRTFCNAIFHKASL